MFDKEVINRVQDCVQKSRLPVRICWQILFVNLRWLTVNILDKKYNSILVIIVNDELEKVW